jgi:hypothetical protein
VTFLEEPAAAADHDRVLPLVQAVVVMHRRGGRLFQKRHLVKAGGGGGFLQYLDRLQGALRSHRAAEFHRSPDHRTAHRRTELATRGEADMFQDVGGDMHDDLAHQRVQPKAEH